MQTRKVETYARVSVPAPTDGWHVSALTAHDGAHDDAVLGPGATLVFGRRLPTASSDRLNVDDDEVSERSVEISVVPEQRAFVTPCEGVTNPVFLDGARIKERTEVGKEGGILKVGRSHVVISRRRDVVAGVVCRSGVMRAAIFDLMKIARAPRRRLPILLDGETGTGKSSIAMAVGAAIGRRCDQVVLSELPSELVASALFGHKRGAFTGALAEREGAISAAGEGLLFIDEIGDLSPADQVRLLRVVRERKYRAIGDTSDRDVRCGFIFATNRDLDAEVAAGRFRFDLLQRIRGLRVTIPPLRARPADLPALLDHFLRETGGEVPADAYNHKVREAIAARSWPGNVGEFSNFVELALGLESFREALGVIGAQTAVAASAPLSASVQPRSLEEVRPWSEVTADLKGVYAAHVGALAEAFGEARVCERMGIDADTYRRLWRRRRRP